MVATSRSWEVRSLLRRSEELATEMARLGEEQRMIARELAALDGATVVVARRRSWPSAVGGALVAVLLAAPLVVMAVRRQDSVVASPAAAVATIAPVPAEPVTVTPVAPLAVPQEVRRVTAIAPPPSLTGALTIVCMPKCTRIVDNGVNIGPGHLFNRPSAVGVHHLRLEADGVVRTVVADVRRGDTTDVRVSLFENIPWLRD